MAYRIPVTAEGIDVDTLATMLDGVDGAQTEVRRRRQDQLALDSASVELLVGAMGTVNALIAALATIWVARRPSAPQDRGQQDRVVIRLWTDTDEVLATVDGAGVVLETSGPLPGDLDEISRIHLLSEPAD